MTDSLAGNLSVTTQVTIETVKDPYTEIRSVNWTDMKSQV